MDPKDGGFVHVVLTPGIDENGDFSMEVCQAEPIGPEEAQRLAELFAKVNAAQERGEFVDCACPICTPAQQKQVAEAVRRAMREGAPFSAEEGMRFRKRRTDN